MHEVSPVPRDASVAGSAANALLPGYPTTVIPAERAGASPGEREPESSDQKRFVPHAGRGLPGRQPIGPTVRYDAAA